MFLLSKVSKHTYAKSSNTRTSKHENDILAVTAHVLPIEVTLFPAVNIVPPSSIHTFKGMHIQTVLAAVFYFSILIYRPVRHIVFRTLL